MGTRVPRAPHNRSLRGWLALGETIRAAGGDREKVARAWSDYTYRNFYAADALEAVVRPPGSATGGARYDWPSAMEEQAAIYESLVAGDQLAASLEETETGDREKALAALRADEASLMMLASGVRSHAQAGDFSEPGVVAEMLRRIGDRRARYGAEITRLAGTPLASEQDRRAVLLRTDLATLRELERALFASIEDRLDSGAAPERISHALDRVRDLHTQWYLTLNQLRALYQETGRVLKDDQKLGPDTGTYRNLANDPRRRR